MEVAVETTSLVATVGNMDMAALAELQLPAPGAGAGRNLVLVVVAVYGLTKEVGNGA